MSEDGVEDCDVIICGCGPTGALLSALLGRLRLKHVVLERELDITTDPRGIVLDEDGIRIAQGVSIYKDLFEDVGSGMITSPREKLGEVQSLVLKFCTAMSMFRFIQGGQGLHVRPFLQFDYRTVPSPSPVSRRIIH
jgi:hypothetical protein